MRDKLTKKRIHVDYELIIRVLDLDLKFTEYCWTRSSNISMRRKALAFLRSEKVDIERVYQDCLEHGLKTFDDFKNFHIEICKYNLWEQDD